MNYIKCNYDCRFMGMNTESEAAWIFRDHNGTHSGAAKGRGSICTSSLEAELQALLMTVQHSWSKGYRNVIFEGDTSDVPQLTKGCKKNFKLHNWICKIKK